MVVEARTQKKRVAIPDKDRSERFNKSEDRGKMKEPDPGSSMGPNFRQFLSKNESLPTQAIKSESEIRSF